MANRNKKTSNFIRNHLEQLIEAIKAAQGAGETGDKLSGSEKLDFAAEFLAGTFDIPLVPEWLEVQMVKVALTTIIELAKSLFGDTDWFEGLVSLWDERPESAAAELGI